MGKRTSISRAKSSRHVPTELSSDVATQIPHEPNVHRVRASTFTGFSGFGGQGYGMADFSNARGLVYFPQLDTRREVTPYTRTEGMRKARYSCANIGIANRVITGMGRMVAGTGSMPNPTTKATEWNKLCRARIDAVYGSALTYDLAGKYNGYTAQAPTLSARFRDGDVGKVFARDEAGNLRMATYEGHQIDGSDQTGDNIMDGVRVDRHNRAISFFIRGGEDAGKSVEVPAASMILLASYPNFGAPRGVTVLKHAINNMIDMGEMSSFLKHGVKAAARIGYALTRAVDAPGRPPGFTGGTGVNPTRTQTVTKSDGTSAKVKTEEVFSQTGGEIPELPPGWDIKMLLDQRPHPNTFEFWDFLIRDISLGCDWPPELLWNIAKLGGANTRYVMADAQSVIEKEQQLFIDTCLAREYFAFVTEEIVKGRLPKCPDPEYWAHEWIPPSRLTVDYGREGKLHLEMIKSGALTFRRFFGWQGLGLDQIDSWLDEVKQITDGVEARFKDADGKPDQSMKQFILQALYQRVGLASSLEPAPTAEEIALAQRDEGETNP